MKIKTVFEKVLFDVHTPVAIYLRLRDRFRDTVLLEGADYHSAQEGFSLIGINAIGGIEVKDPTKIELKYPNRNPKTIEVKDKLEVPDLLWSYMQKYEVEDCGNAYAKRAQGLFGYSSYNAVQFFDTYAINAYNSDPEKEIPLMRYRLYQYVLVIDHFKQQMYICENLIDGMESDLDSIKSLIYSSDFTRFQFQKKGDDFADMPDEEYLETVKKCIASCKRGDVFQIVPSRGFGQAFAGDEFNVYRALRSINPSPYMFYFDYGDYKLLGSSPESQIIIENGHAIIHPIAGTYRRTGDKKQDEALAEKLQNDPKEVAEHTMLVDLARNDLSRSCKNVYVNYYKQVHYYSHVLHLVSEVIGEVQKEHNPFKMLGHNFPAGTLSGAPKYRAVELIDKYENRSRGFYAGTLGFVGFDGSFKHAIMIRSMLSRRNTLYYQAGAGVVAASIPESELQEANNKLAALKEAISLAEQIN